MVWAKGRNRCLTTISVVLAILLLTTTTTTVVVSAIEATWPPRCDVHSLDDAAPLPLGVFMPQKESARRPQEISELRRAVDLALRHIHDMPCVLRGSKLQLIYKDTQCSSAFGMKSLFDLVAQKPRPVALFGGLCTEVNEMIAMAAKHWNLTQLSYAETHAKFATSADAHEIYRTFFRIVPGDSEINRARRRLVKHFNWTRVGTLKQSDEPRYALPHESLTTQLEGRHLKVVYTAGVTQNEANSVREQLEQLKDRDVRITIVDADQEMTRRVLCEAHKQSMTGRNYVWIVPGFHGGDWFLDDSSVNCTHDELVSALDGHFALQHATHREDERAELVSQHRSMDVWSALLGDRRRRRSDGSPFVGYVYDGLWAVALALRAAMPEDGAPIASSDRLSQRRLLAAMATLDFQGVTGRIRFISNERLGRVEILQYREGRYVSVGSYDGAENTFAVDDSALEDWRPPADATHVEFRRVFVAAPLALVASGAAGVGATLALIFLAVNVRYRHHRFIKMSSPNMNNAIIAGSILTYVAVVTNALDGRLIAEPLLPALCYAKTWTLCLGFTLAFGSMFSKTWRVHSIFTNIRMDKKAIKDSRLFLILAALAAIDVLVLAVWAFISPFHIRTVPLPSYTEADRVIRPQTERCHSAHSALFQLVLYSIKGLLMLMGCFLAWETRRVNVPALNDSKHIGMSVYALVVCSTIGLAISVILQERVDEQFALTSLFVIFTTTLTLCLVFVPKVIELIRTRGMTAAGVNSDRAYRRGFMKSVVSTKRSQADSLAAASAAAAAAADRESEEKEKLMRAEQENQLRRRTLHQKTQQLHELVERLKALGDDCDDWQRVSADGTLLLSPSSSSSPWAAAALCNGMQPKRGVAIAKSHRNGNNNNNNNQMTDGESTDFGGGAGGAHSTTTLL